MRTAQNQTFAPTGVGILRKAFHIRVRRHDGMPRPQSRGFGLCRGDRSLAGNDEPPLGAHLVTPRFAYAHHGVYVGAGSVVHYGGFPCHWRRGPVEEIPFKLFAQGHPVWVRPARPEGLPCAEIVRRARARLGENRHRFFSNNCEHLSEWCVNGEHRSPQLDRFLTPLRRVLRALAGLARPHRHDRQSSSGQPLYGIPRNRC
jgi:Lecithin retinol acyltransferase